MCVLVPHDISSVPLRGFGSGLAASGLTTVRTCGNSAGAGWSSVRATDCTNRWFSWPGYRCGRGPDWTTTGVIRPVTEIESTVSIAVDEFTGLRADQLVDAPLADQPTRRAVRLVATMVDLARREPAIRHRQHATGRVVL